MPEILRGKETSRKNMEHRIFMVAGYSSYAFSLMTAGIWILIDFSEEILKICVRIPLGHRITAAC